MAIASQRPGPSAERSGSFERGERRALGDAVWGRKAARLPDEGVLLLCTDLQGNRDDYERMKDLYDRELAAGRRCTLVFLGDLVHGPSPEFHEPGAWPSHLGTPYFDRSAELILDFEEFSRTASAFAILGNHEHAHIGGPVVPKFYPDEAAVLDEALGENRGRVHAFLRSWPLLAVGRCGVVLTHGAPRSTERDLAAFESLSYDGHEQVPLWAMHDAGTVGSLLWSRSASELQARALLRATSLDGQPNAFVVFGHDVVREGIEVIGDEQVCVSTSFALLDADKTYLRLDLARRYRSAGELRAGEEILRLYDAPHPDAR
jgi:hypothetical protein